MHIRQATEDDIPLIRQLAHSIWPVAYKEILNNAQLNYMLQYIYSHASLLEQMKAQHQFIFVVDEHKEVGFASYSPRLNDPSIFKLHKLYVLTDLHGKGIGRFMLDHIIQDVKSANASFLDLNVNRNNKAIEFYKRAGFEIIAQEDVDIGEGYFMNDYIMRLDLQQMPVNQPQTPS